MARANPEAERLRRENDMLRARIARLTEEPADVPFAACDNSCVVTRPRGMATNGGCRCDDRKLRQAVMYWRGVAEHRQASIQMLLSGETPTLRGALEEALDLAHEGWSYAGDYFREKWECEKREAELRATLKGSPDT